MILKEQNYLLIFTPPQQEEITKISGIYIVLSIIIIKHYTIFVAAQNNDF